MLGKKLNLAKKVALFFMTITLFQTSVIGGVLFFYFKSNVEKSLTGSMETVIQNNANNVDELFARIAMAMDIMISEKSGFDEILTSYSDDLMVDIKQYEKLKVMFRNYMYITLEPAVPQYSAVFFVDDSMPLSQIFQNSYGSDYMKSRYAMNTAVMYKNNGAKEEDWFLKTVEQNGEQYWFKAPEEADILYISRYLGRMELGSDLSQIKKKVLGVICIGIDVSHIKARLDTSGLTEKTTIILTDNNNRVVYSGDASLEGKRLTEIFDIKALAFEGEQMQTVFYDSQETLMQMKQLEGGMSLVTLIPRGDIDRIAAASVNIILIVAATMLIAGCLLVIFMASLVVDPIKKLSDHMKTSNDLRPISCEGISDDEVGVMYNSFNRLMQRIQFLIGQLMRSMRLQKEAELKTLQAQINPHFIYNTMDSLCCISLTRGQDDIAEKLSALADLMRYNIKEPDAMVPVSHELEVIEGYIGIQRMRSGDKLSFYCDSELDLESVLIPKMVIQPLVENCVVHCNNGDGACQEIIIGIRAQEEHLIIGVHDNGHCESIEDINLHLRGVKTISKETGGFGIRNVDQRIKMKFGENFGLCYYRAKDGGTLAELKLPEIKR